MKWELNGSLKKGYGKPEPILLCEGILKIFLIIELKFAIFYIMSEPS